MKRFLLIVIVTAVVLGMQAQEMYNDFLEEGKVWHYHYYNYFQSLSYDYSLFVSGDTVINGHQYKKVCQDTKDRVVCSCHIPFRERYPCTPV